MANIDYAPAEPATSNGHKLDLYIPVGGNRPLPVVVGKTVIAFLDTYMT